MENMMPPPPPDSSKAPGYRSASQRMVNSPISTTAFIQFICDHCWIFWDASPLILSCDCLYFCALSALTSYASISGSPVYLHGHTPVGTPSFNRQHFSPHPWSASTSGTWYNPCLFLILFFKLPLIVRFLENHFLLDLLLSTFCSLTPYSISALANILGLRHTILGSSMCRSFSVTFLVRGQCHFDL